MMVFFMYVLSFRNMLSKFVPNLKEDKCYTNYSIFLHGIHSMKNSLFKSWLWIVHESDILATLQQSLNL